MELNKTYFSIKKKQKNYFFSNFNLILILLKVRLKMRWNRKKVIYIKYFSFNYTIIIFLDRKEYKPDFLDNTRLKIDLRDTIWIIPFGVKYLLSFNKLIICDHK